MSWIARCVDGARGCKDALAFHVMPMSELIISVWLSTLYMYMGLCLLTDHGNQETTVMVIIIALIFYVNGLVLLLPLSLVKETTSRNTCIMEYGSTPYIGMAPKKMAAPLYVYKVICSKL